MSFTATCGICGKPCYPPDRSLYRRVTGWERKGSADGRRSGSDITLREPLDEWAHGGCVALAKDGIAVGQERLDVA